jgi:CRP/FNR family transcriptional regulator
MGTTSEDTIALLHRVPVFSALGEDDLARVADVTVPRRFEAGEVVFREGDESDTCYIVRSGHTRATREHQDGRSITLARFGPGDIFGELAMFDDERRSATVEAVEGTEAIAILGGDMRRLLREHPDIAVKLLAALGRRLRETNERLTRQSFQTVQSRRRADHRDAGRPRSARRLLARVREPLPRRARTGRDHQPGPRQAGRARPRCTRAVRVLSAWG